jgi:hypothetical protein
VSLAGFVGRLRSTIGQTRMTMYSSSLYHGTGSRAYAADPLAEPRDLLPPDMQRFAEAWDGARRRVPALRDAALARVVNGPEAFTPDGEFVLGATEVAGLWVAAGFCVHGLAGAAGVGKVMAERIADGLPEYDVAPMDVRRIGAYHRSAGYAKARALDAYSRCYDVVHPYRDALAAAGAPAERLRCLVLDDPRAVCLGTEPVRVGGTPAGWVTSSGYGYRVDRNIAYAYLPSDLEPGTRVQLGVLGRWKGPRWCASRSTTRMTPACGPRRPTR